jgi:DNA-directed RNA polymerase I, II, and III subunit RPABC2
MYNDDYETDTDNSVGSDEDINSVDDDLSVKDDHESSLSDDLEYQMENVDDDLEDPRVVDRNDEDTVMSEVGADLSHVFEPEQINDYIVTNHPECLPISYEELQTMLPVVRDSRGVIIDDFHTTIPILTKYERTRVLGQRASMIENGAKLYIEVPSHIIDGIIIAEMELQAKKIPFIIKRPLPNNGFEYWKLSDLEQL